MSNNNPPWLQGSSLCSWFYTLILSLLTGVVGGGLIAICYSSFSLPITEIGIVGRFCLVSGIVMVVFVLFWISFIFCSWRGSTYATEECQRGKGPAKSISSSSLVTSLLGLVSLVLLTISILLELSGTGLLWWASQQLSDKYQVRGKCFCVRGGGQAGDGVTMRDIFSVNCPVVDGFVCEAVFSAVVVTMDSVTVSTSDCQRLDGSKQDTDCLQFLAFWNIFKVLRIVLPVLALVKLPVLLVNCSRWLGKEEKYKSSHGKFAADSISWIGLDILVSPLKLVDPVQFYSNMCAPVDQPPLGERHAPVGQEDDSEGNLPHKHTMIHNSIVIAKTLNPCSNHPSMTVVHCPVPPYGTLHDESQTSQAGMTKNDSPPDIEEHTISTPKHPRLKTPSFDLSKVVKPVFFNTSMEEEIPTSNLNLKPEAIRSTRLSSFSSPHNFKAPPPPPLPKPQLVTNARHPPPPFSRSATTLPRPVRLISTVSNSTIPGQMSPPPTPTVQLVLDPHDSDTSGSVQSVTPIVRLQPTTSHPSKSSPKWQGSTPIQLSSSIREISQKARNKSSYSTVDWTKLP